MKSAVYWCPNYRNWNTSTKISTHLSNLRGFCIKLSFHKLLFILSIRPLSVICFKLMNMTWGVKPPPLHRFTILINSSKRTTSFQTTVQERWACGGACGSRHRRGGFRTVWLFRWLRLRYYLTYRQGQVGILCFPLKLIKTISTFLNNGRIKWRRVGKIPREGHCGGPFRGPLRRALTSYAWRLLLSTF